MKESRIVFRRGANGKARDERGFAIVAAVLLIALSIFFGLGAIVVVEHSRLIEKGVRTQQLQLIRATEDLSLSIAGTDTLVFSWVYSDPEGDPQSHYEIWIGTSAGANNIWNSGQVASNATSATCDGALLPTGGTYHFQIRVKDGHEWSGWMTGTFEW